MNKTYSIITNISVRNRYKNRKLIQLTDIVTVDQAVFTMT